MDLTSETGQGSKEHVKEEPLKIKKEVVQGPLIVVEDSDDECEEDNDYASLPPPETMEEIEMRLAYLRHPASESWYGILCETGDIVNLYMLGSIG